MRENPGNRLCRPRPLHAAARSRSTRRPRSGAGLHQRRRPRRHPPIPASMPGRLPDNSSMMEVDFLPEHLVILGGSYRPRVRPDVPPLRQRGDDRPAQRLIPREDEDVSTAVREILEGEGIDVRLDADATQARAGAVRSVSVTVAARIGSDGSHLVVATDRRPTTDDLGLDKAGIETDERGYIKVDSQLRTNVPDLRDGRCERPRRLHPPPTTTSRSSPPICSMDGGGDRGSDPAYGLFIDPPLGRAG